MTLILKAEKIEDSELQPRVRVRSYDGVIDQEMPEIPEKLLHLFGQDDVVYIHVRVNLGAGLVTILARAEDQRW